LQIFRDYFGQVGCAAAAALLHSSFNRVYSVDPISLSVSAGALAEAEKIRTSRIVSPT
jgi:hypothetical protein